MAVNKTLKNIPIFTGRLVFKCRHCEADFRTKASLNRHLTTHSDYSGVGYVHFYFSSTYVQKYNMKRCW